MLLAEISPLDFLPNEKAERRIDEDADPNDPDEHNTRVAAKLMTGQTNEAPPRNGFGLRYQIYITGILANPLCSGRTSVRRYQYF